MNLRLEFYWDEKEAKAKLAPESLNSLANAYSDNAVLVVEFLEDCNQIVSQECREALKAFYSTVEASG